ncbi:uncharacterized protein LOC110021383 isoform X3 [Phalaenopsis equestris]|uniref:uncharacterized protein LOC110021383 isoform X3 n=1 Tax=Phalaenopsis equestris TaxID=78828 RepID=UPI0009E4EA1D|nr:uncharacterized protein LOC110021383 isoform X3 [Phalaenopsis equestris]
MEELRTLQRVQSMLFAIEAAGLSTNDRDSDRFIANFVLFMGQQRGALDMQKRRDLIYGHLNKVSASTLDVLLQTNAGSHSECLSQHDFEGVSYVQIIQTEFEDEAVIKIGAMQRANSTIEDFCCSYFMFHGMDATISQSIFMFLPVLYFAESYIYQLDTLNENELLRSADDTSENSCHKWSSRNPFEPLVHLLQQQGLMTERIQNELNLGVEYWKLERKLCDGLTKKNTTIGIEDVMRAIHLKSFDYRVLNLLLYQLRGQPVNELHMEFLSVSEFLVEVSDDLYDYEEDVIDNTFNILRMFVGIYGPSKAPVMLAKCITEAEENYDRLSRALDPELCLNYWRRCEEATRQGCSNLKHGVGKWTIPSIIVDEESFRLQAFAENTVLLKCFSSSARSNDADLLGRDDFGFLLDVKAQDLCSLAKLPFFS